MSYEKEIGSHLANLLVEMVNEDSGDFTKLPDYQRANPTWKKKAAMAYQHSFDDHENEGIETAHKHAMAAVHSTFERMKKAGKSNANRRERDSAMRDMGMTKVRGSQSGKTYWESTDLSNEDLELLGEDKKVFHKVLHDAGYTFKSGLPNHDVFHHPTKPKVGVMYGKSIGLSAVTSGHKFDTPEELKKHLGLKEEDRFKNGEDVKLGKRDAEAIRNHYVGVATSKHAWEATEKAKRTGKREDHSAAHLAHAGAAPYYEAGTSNWKGHVQQAQFHKNAAYPNDKS